MGRAPHRTGDAARPSAWWLVVVAAGCSLPVSCGGGQTRGHPLDRSWDDDEGAELAEFVASWAPGPPVEMPDVAVGVLADGVTVVGRELPDGPPWRTQHGLETRPIVAGSMVVVQGGGRLSALDALSGELQWERPAEGKLRGASDDGELTVVTMQGISGVRSTLLAVDRDGVVVRQLDVRGQLGAPALRAGTGFVPWNDQMVVVFDLERGKELARVLATGRVSRAWTVDGEIFMGETSVMRFDSSVVEARRGKSPTLRPPPRELPGRPRWLRPGTEPTPVLAQADDVAALAGRPAVSMTSDGLGFANDMLLARFRGVAMGLEAQSGRTVWVRTNDRSWLGDSAAEDGFCLCDGRGLVECLSAATGATLWRSELGEPVRACVLQVDDAATDERQGSRPVRVGEASAHATAANGGAEQGAEHLSRGRREPEGRSPTLVAQIVEALGARDVLLLPMQLELLADLDAIAAEDATEALVRLSSRERLARELRTEARRRLAARRTGLGAMVTALERAAERPCLAAPVEPVAELARALGRARHERAAAPLARLARCVRLDDAGVAVMEALEELAAPEHAEALALCVARHAHGPPTASRVRLVRAGASALVRLGRRRVVAAIATTAGISAELRALVRGLLDG